MTHWHSLYLWSEQRQAVIEAIQNYLEAQSYIPYNPFGRYPGMAYPVTLKIFVSPVQDDCIRILFEGHEFDALASYLSHIGDCLALALDNTDALVQFYRAGKRTDLSYLRQYCKPDAEAQLDSVLNSDMQDLPVLEQERIGDVPLNALPENIQQMARQVDSRQANHMFAKLKKQFVKSLGQQDAQALLQSKSDWHSQGGQYIRSLMACLSVPDTWLDPDFSTLRQAFALQSRQAYDADTPLFPGDTEAIASVPDALDYVPIYGGKRE